MTETIASTQIEDCSTFIDRAAREKERVRVSREGKEVAAVIPIEDLDLLEKFEDRLDLLEAMDANAEAKEKGGIISWEQFEAELGIS